MRLYRLYRYYTKYINKKYTFTTITVRDKIKKNIFKISN